jgi:ribosomal protein S4
MQTTKRLSKPRHNNKNFTKQQMPASKTKKSNSAVQLRFVASMPVRRQLPLKLTKEHYDAVKRMQAFTSWATKSPCVKSVPGVLKTSTFKRYGLRCTKLQRTRRVFSGAAQGSKKGSALALTQRSSLSSTQRTSYSVSQPTVRSIWSFLTWYKQTSCTKETRRWRARQHKALIRWSNLSVVHPTSNVGRTGIVRNLIKKPQKGFFNKQPWKKEAIDSRKYYSARCVYRAHYRITHGISPVEAKVRFLQARFKQWYMLRQRKTTPFTWLASAYSRVCKMFSIFIARFNKLKKDQKNVDLVRMQFKQIMRKLLPQKRSLLALKNLSVRARYKYIMVWKFTSFLWRFIAPDFMLRPSKLLPLSNEVSTKPKTEQALTKFKVSASLGSNALTIGRTSWLNYGNKQLDMVVRDQSIKLKKIWTNYTMQPLKPRAFWQKRNKQLFWISKKEKNKAQCTVTPRSSLITTPVVFSSVFKRLLTTVRLCTPVADVLVVKKRMNPILSRRLRGLTKTKKLLKSTVQRKLFVQRFWGARLKYLKLRCAMFFKTRARTTAREIKVLWRAIVQHTSRLKLRQHRGYEYHTRYLTRGQKKFLRRQRSKLFTVAQNKNIERKSAPDHRYFSALTHRPFVKKRLLAAFYHWLRRAQATPAVLKNSIKKQNSTLPVSLARKIKKIVINSPAKTLSYNTSGANIFTVVRRKAALRRLRRILSRLVSRRLVKRGINRGETHRALSPSVLSTKLLPTAFDISAVRTTLGKKWRKKLRKVRAIKVWSGRLEKTNVHLARLFPSTSLHAVSHKAIKIASAQTISGTTHRKLLEVPKLLNIDSFPFKRVTNQERRQQFIERKRLENPTLKRSGNSLLSGQESFSALLGVRTSVAISKSAAAATLRDFQLSGSLQDLDRLDNQSKTLAHAKLRRAWRAVNSTNPYAITRKVKRIAGAQKARRVLLQSLWRSWTKKLSKRRQEITMIKQKFPRKGPRRRRYKRGLQKQLRYLLSPRKTRGRRDKHTTKKLAVKLFYKLTAARFARCSWQKAQLDSNNYLLDTIKVKKTVNARLAQALKTNIIWQSLKQLEQKKVLSSISYLSPQYRLRHRLLTKLGRTAPSREEFTRRKKVNRLRRQKAMQLYAQRRTNAMKWNKKNRPFKRSAQLGYEEKFKRNLHKLQWVDSGDIKTEYAAGYPSVIGQRRSRRVFVPKFNKNRWWKSTPISLPHHHPYALYSRNTGLAFSKAASLGLTYKKFGWPAPEILADREHCKVQSAAVESYDNACYLRGGKLVDLLLPDITKRRPFFTNERTLNGNRGWRLLENGLNNTVPRHVLTGRVSSVATSLLSLERSSVHFNSIWSQYAEKTSAKAATQLRSSFIADSTYWLQDRPLEKLVASWTLREWSIFHNFALGVTRNTCSNRESAVEFKARFLTTSRQELFVKTPNWWQEETAVRAKLLFKIMSTGAAPSVVMQMLSKSLDSRGLFSAQANLGWQEKKLFIFSSLQTAQAEQKTSFTAALEPSTRENSVFGDKPFTALYYTWLAGVETYLKKTRSARSSQSYNELRQDVITELGTEQPRFPGTGRRKFTFDSLLRAHYTKIMPLRFRRVAGMRFQKLRPHASAAFTAQLPRFEATVFTRRGQRQNKYTGVLAYPTKRSRELYGRLFKSKNGALHGPIAKCRLAALPLKVSSDITGRISRKLRSLHVASNTATSEALLQHALRRRYVARSIRDLRKAGRRRRLPRYQSKPFWINNQIARKKNRAERHELYKLPFAGGYAPATSAQWACSDFALQVAKTNSRAVKMSTAAGELLVAPAQLSRSRTAVRLTTLRSGNSARRWKQEYALGYKHVKNMKLVHGKFRWRNLRKIRGRVRRLKKSCKRKNKFYPQQWPLAVRSTKQTLLRFDQARSRFHYRFMKQTQPSMVLTPLHFRKQTTHISVSAAEKERWRLHIQATRQRKYRRLTEQSEALTKLFPQIISRIIAKKMLDTQFSPQSVIKLVQAVYWNLRVYLQHDFGRRKFLSRDDNVKRILELKKEVTTAATERFFSLLELTQARHRFQPQKLHPGPSLLRGAAEWQRQFLPRFYELNLEDPQKYGHLTVTPLKIFRANINRKKISEWETRNVPGLMENRFARLTTERHGKNSRCFENMLMTTRRLPVTGGYGAAATLQVINPVGASTARKPFFSRTFTTHAGFKSGQVRTENRTLVASRMAVARRQTVTELYPLAQAHAVATHRLLKQSGLGRARAQQTVSASEIGLGSLDIRLLRAKSPRNAEYIQREKLTNKVDLSCAAGVYTNVIATTSTTVFRSPRGFIAKTFYPVNTIVQEKSYASSLRTSRSIALVRRRPALLKARGQSIKYGLPKAITRRLFTNRFSAKERNLRAELFFIQKNKRRGPLALTTQMQENQEKQSTIIRAERAILHFRKASTRAAYKYQAPTPVVLNRSIKLNATAWNILKRNRFDETLREKMKLQGVQNKFKRRLAVKTRADYKVLRAPLKTYRKVFLFRNKVQVGEKLGLLKRFNVPNRSRHTTYWAASARLTTSKKRREYNLTSYFKTFAKQERRNKKVISSYANRVERKRARTLFADRRPQLWKALTLRWMKKFRLLKYWLKTVKYSFKHKVWGVDGQPALPDVLFKMARLRLRKLEWRESSDRFERPGLRHAFTFHPKERRHARWLESLMYRRALYSYQRGEYRRDQLPREQKSQKWLQRLRKLMYRRKPTHLYIKRRRWPTLRRYNQKLHRSAFNISTSKAMLKRFRKLTRRKPATTGFEKLMVGFGDRLDVNLMLLNIAPTTFWAREIAPMGLFRVNGKIIRDASFRFTPGDHIELIWEKLQKLRTHFNSSLKRYDKSRHLQNSSLIFPSNFAYNASLRTAQYLRRPRMDDLSESSRINARLFRWSRLDSGLGK